MLDWLPISPNAQVHYIGEHIVDAVWFMWDGPGDFDIDRGRIVVLEAENEEDAKAELQRYRDEGWGFVFSEYKGQGYWQFTEPVM